MLESAVKQKMVRDIRAAGGYARRIEDQYAVGILDMVILPQDSPVTFFVEVKVVKGNQFGPTPRQFIEMKNLQIAAGNLARAMPILVGWKDDVYYICPPRQTTNVTECWASKPRQKFNEALKEYYESVR